MLLNTPQQYAIKLNGQIISKYQSQLEAQSALMSLKTTNPLYESASISIISEDNKELLLG